jgi:retron-type reverse transcriptase
LEDKVLQRAVVEVLNAVYETDFVGFSYGFRPGRSQHDALNALATAIVRTKAQARHRASGDSPEGYGRVHW